MLLKSVYRLARPSLLVAAGTFAGEAALRGFSQPASVCDSAAAPELTMIYFPVRALAEPARMILEFGGVAYEDASPQQAYGVPWKDAKDKTPFGQLPLLLVDGKADGLARTPTATKPPTHDASPRRRSWPRLARSSATAPRSCLRSCRPNRLRLRGAT